MDKTFSVVRKSRELLLSFLNNYSVEQLNKIPHGFNNNLFWNIAHVVVSQQLLVYKLSGLEMMVSSEMVNSYRKGTRPVKDSTIAEVEELKSLLFSTINKTEQDYKNGIFVNYHTFTSEFGYVMASVDDALAFNNFHEGVHLGVMMGIRKFL
ncbi:DinB family protein [Flavobacterium sp. MK4S-17]|uniref:DinB family protein n=1 Tax=Flavobacterium sp. MK4S-17 TaxID=2543737 RepID=UPI001358A99B|nr:DinB family protein [Flavobacterium sp. MK4S-17]